MEKTNYEIRETAKSIEEQEVDVSVYMGACNNAKVMFWMVPEVDEPGTEVNNKVDSVNVK